VVLIRHLNVFLGVAPASVLSKESGISTIQDVDFRICKLGIRLCIHGAILGSDMASHEGSTVGRVFAVEDEEDTSAHGSIEELARKEVLVIVVDSAIDVATIVLVLKSAINHHLLVKLLTVLSVQDVHKGFPCNTGDGVGWILGQEMGEGGLLCLLDIHNRLQCRRGALLALRLVLHDVSGMLEHA
jgi:hypothetical protein